MAGTVFITPGIVNWVIITGNDMQLLDTERTVMSSITPLQDIDTCVFNACNYVRGYIAGGGNPLEPAPSIPPECVDDAIHIARAAYLMQEPTGTLFTKARQDERTLAIAHLRDIAKDVTFTTQAALPATTPLRLGSWGTQTMITMRTNQL